jgi:hypothetical protein
MKKIEVTSYSKAIKYLVLGSKIINFQGHYDKTNAAFCFKTLTLEVPNAGFFEDFYRDEFEARTYLMEFTQDFIGHQNKTIDVEFILDKY